MNDGIWFRKKLWKGVDKRRFGGSYSLGVEYIYCLLGTSFVTLTLKMGSYPWVVGQLAHANSGTRTCQLPWGPFTVSTRVRSNWDEQGGEPDRTIEASGNMWVYACIYSKRQRGETSLRDDLDFWVWVNLVWQAAINFGPEFRRKSWKGCLLRKGQMELLEH